MGLVERILGERLHVGEDLLCRLFRDAVSNAPRNLHCAVCPNFSVDEIFFLLQHDRLLLLRHGPPNQIGPAVAVARQIPDDLHHLFLINQASVCYIQNVSQFRRDILNLFRIFLVFNITGDRIHRTRTVQGNACHNVLEASGPECLHEGGHSTAFQLEHTVCLPVRDHPVHLRIIVGEFRQIDGFPVILPDQLQRIPDHRQVPEAQEVHLQQTQLLDGGHVKLCGNTLVRGVQRDVFHHRFPGDHHPRRMG